MTDVFKIKPKHTKQRVRKSKRHSKIRQKSVYNEIHLGTQEYLESRKKMKHSVVLEKTLVPNKHTQKPTSDFGKLDNFSTTLSDELSCKEFNFLQDGDAYLDQLHKIIFDGKDNTEYLCLKPWYDDVKFEEIKRFLMSKPQKDRTKILIRQMTRDIKRLQNYTPEYPLHTYMYKVEAYKKIFLKEKFLSFKSAYMYDYKCDKCSTDSYYNDYGRRIFKRFFTSRRQNAWYQCIDSFECDCKETRDLYYEYCEDCFFKLPNTLFVIETRLLTAFLLKRWEVPDDLLEKICPPIFHSTLCF